MGNELHRGEKWFQVRRVADLKGKTKVLDWLNSQKSIVDDIKVYEDSLKTDEEDYLSYTKLELQELLDKEEIEYQEANTKSELIELLKGEI